MVFRFPDSGKPEILTPYPVSEKDLFFRFRGFRSSGIRNFHGFCLFFDPVRGIRNSQPSSQPEKVYFFWIFRNMNSVTPPCILFFVSGWFGAIENTPLTKQQKGRISPFVNCKSVGPRFNRS